MAPGPALLGAVALPLTAPRPVHYALPTASVAPLTTFEWAHRELRLALGSNDFNVSAQGMRSLNLKASASRLSMGMGKKGRGAAEEVLPPQGMCRRDREAHAQGPLSCARTRCNVPRGRSALLTLSSTWHPLRTVTALQTHTSCGFRFGRGTSGFAVSVQSSAGDAPHELQEEQATDRDRTHTEKGNLSMASLSSLASIRDTVSSKVSDIGSTSGEVLHEVLEQNRKPRALLLLLAAPLLLLAGLVLALLLALRPRAYRAIVRLPDAYGVTVGTPVRVRGSEVGVVVALRPSLKGVDAVMEIGDERTAIPRRSSFVANQLGLVKDPVIDIAPGVAVPKHVHWPKEVEACRKENKIVCEGDVVEGTTGVCVDELVALWVKMGRKSEAEKLKRYGPASVP